MTTVSRLAELRPVWLACRCPATAREAATIAFASAIPKPAARTRPELGRRPRYTSIRRDRPEMFAPLWLVVYSWGTW